MHMKQNSTICFTFHCESWSNLYYGTIDQSFTEMMSFPFIFSFLVIYEYKHTTTMCVSKHPKVDHFMISGRKRMASTESYCLSIQASFISLAQHNCCSYCTSHIYSQNICIHPGIGCGWFLYLKL